VIAGKVLGPDGQPLYNAGITLMRMAYVDGRKQLTGRSSADAQTDDRGEYRLFNLAPGRYYLRARPPAGDGMQDAFIRSRYETIGQVSQTLGAYYPAATDPQRAEPVEVRAGRVTSGVNIALQEAPVATIRGRVENVGSAAAKASYVGLALYDADGSSFGVASVNLQTGEFEIRGAIPPGKYSAIVIANEPAGIGAPSNYNYFSRQELNLTGGPVPVTLRPGAPLTGAVRVDGSPVNLGRLRLTLHPADSISFPETFLPAQTAGPDGKFTFPSVVPDRYRVKFSGLPETAYVKSVRLGDDAVPDNILDLTRPTTGALEIVVSAKTGTVQGTLTEALFGATVALVPATGKEYRTATTDERGAFTFRGVPPGDYKAYAWEEVEDGAWTDPEFLKAFQGRPVTAREGVTEKVELGVSKQ